MNDKHCVRLMRTEIRNFKNVTFGEIPYVNNVSIKRRGTIENSDIVGLYGQNGSGKTALVESLDIIKWAICGMPIAYESYAGLLSRDNPTEITTDFFIENVSTKNKYMATYTCFLRANDEQKKIEIFREKLVYWSRGSSWKANRSFTFENPYYNNSDILTQQRISVDTQHEEILKSIHICRRCKISLLFVLKKEFLFFQ